MCCIRTSLLKVCLTYAYASRSIFISTHTHVTLGAASEDTFAQACCRSVAGQAFHTDGLVPLLTASVFRQESLHKTRHHAAGTLNRLEDGEEPGGCVFIMNAIPTFVEKQSEDDGKIEVEMRST